MSKTFVYDRFDVLSGMSRRTWQTVTKRVSSSDGAYVAAEDAINREAVLQAQIRTLEVQLKDAKVMLGDLLDTLNDNNYRPVGVWEPDGSVFKTYRKENLNGVTMYVKESNA